MKLIFSHYLPLADYWQFWDASQLPMTLVAESTIIPLETLQQRYES